MKMEQSGEIFDFYEVDFSQYEVSDQGAIRHHIHTAYAFKRQDYNADVKCDINHINRIRDDNRAENPSMDLFWG